MANICNKKRKLDEENKTSVMELLEKINKLETKINKNPVNSANLLFKNSMLFIKALLSILISNHLYYFVPLLEN